MNDKFPIDAYILAGGKSSRMGQEKGLIQVHDRHLIEYVIGHLKNCVEHIYICTGNPDYGKFGYELIPDFIPDAGPSAAIAAALFHTKKTKIFVMSCDTPFVDERIIRQLISLSDKSEITLPLVQNYPEPLCGVYAKSCAERWKQMLEQNVRKLQSFIGQFNYQFIDAIEDLKADEISFMNINTPEMLALAGKEGRWL